MSKQTIQSPGGEYFVDAPLDAWVQGRNVLYIRRRGTSSTSIIGKTATLTAALGGTSPLGGAGTLQNVQGVFTVDSKGFLVIDISDILRTYKIGDKAHFTIFVDGTIDPTDITMTIAGLIDPAEAFAPMTDEIATLTDGTRGAFFWPQKIVQGFNHEDAFPMMESYGIKNKHDGEPLYLFYDDASEGSFAFDTQINDLTASDTFPVFRVMLATAEQDAPKTIIAQRQLVPRDCGREYALVQWVSFTGQTRRAVWELKSHKMQSINEVELEPTLAEVDVLKGRRDTFALVLDDLCPFDVWYYGDVALSSRVEVSTDEGETWRRVNVTAKEVTPFVDDAGTHQQLSINMTYCDYDTIIL